jgi:superkiller protein 3
MCIWLPWNSGSALAGQAASGINERFQQATAAMRAGRLEEAKAGFSAVVKLVPTFAEAYLNLGLVLEEQGKNEEAIPNLWKALSLKPRLRGANLFLGIAEYRLNQFDDAIAALKKETTYYSTDANAWMWLGVAQLADNRPDEAAESLDRAAKLDPKNVDILYHRGRAHLLVSKESYDAMYKVDPNSWRVHQVLAQAYAESDRHEEAIAELQVAINKAPTQPGLHEALGTEYLQTGKTDLAEAEFRNELRFDPNSALALYKLGTIEIERGEAAQGKQSIEGALKKNPRLRDAEYYLGRAEMQLGNDEGAIRAFKGAINADSDPEIVQQAWYQLAVVYRRTRRLEEAKQALTMFQKLKDEATEHQQQLFQQKRRAQKQTEPVPNSPMTPE